MSVRKAIIDSKTSFKKYIFYCLDLKTEILNLKYDLKPLTDMVKKVNECNGGSWKTVATTGVSLKRKATYGITTDFSLNRFKGYDHSFGSVQLGFGINYEIFSREQSGRQSIYNELKFKAFKADISNFGKVAQLSFTSIKLTSMIRKYSNGSKGFINFGLVTNGRFNTILEKNPKLLQVAFEFGFGGGVGYKFKKIKSSIEFRYEAGWPTGFSFLKSQTVGIILSKQF